jgi:predicted nucleic acid-binding protein
MRFIDANVFLYATVKLKGDVRGEILERKEKSKQILLRIQRGERVITTVAHVSEVANILEAKVNLETALKFIENLMLAENIEILPVIYEDYLRALLIAKEKSVSLNDALAYLKMEGAGVEEIYTFDNHFRNLDVKIVQE